MVYEEQIQEIYEEHQKIYGSILIHDGDGAREGMRLHLARSRERYSCKYDRY